MTIKHYQELNILATHIKLSKLCMILEKLFESQEINLKQFVANICVLIYRRAHDEYLGMQLIPKRKKTLEIGVQIIFTRNDNDVYFIS